MLSFTWSAFDRGPVARVLDLAITCQESRGKYSLTDELAAFVRLVASSNETQWLCPVTTVTALLDLAAEHLDRGGSLSEEFTAKLSRAAEGMDGGEYLRTLAGTLRLVEQDSRGETDLPPGSEWETRVRFHRLQGFYDNWIAQGEYPSLEDAISAAIDSEHPFCGEFLGPVASEAQYALVCILDSVGSRARLLSSMPWAAPATLTTLLTTVATHMRDRHPTPMPDSDQP